MNGKKVYLIRIFPSNRLQIDSSIVINNKFTFKKYKDLFPYEYWITLDKNRAPLFTFIWDRDVRVFLDSTYGKSTIENSPLSNLEKDVYNKLYKGLSDSILNIGIKLTALNSKKDSVLYYQYTDMQQKLLNQQHDSALRFIETYPRSFLSLEDLNWVWDILSFDECKKYFGIIDWKYLHHPYKNIFEERLKKLAKVSNGKRIDFSLRSIDSTKLSLDYFKGKYLLLDFWGSWCGPCINEISELKKIYSEYHLIKPLEILSISVELPNTKFDNPIKIIHSNQMNWYHVVGYRKNLFPILDDYNVSEFPTLFLIDKSGKIIKYIKGNTQITRLQLEQMMKDLH